MYILYKLVLLEEKVGTSGGGWNISLLKMASSTAIDFQYLHNIIVQLPHLVEITCEHLLKTHKRLFAQLYNTLLFYSVNLLHLPPCREHSSFSWKTAESSLTVTLFFPQLADAILICFEIHQLCLSLAVSLATWCWCHVGTVQLGLFQCLCSRQKW